MNKDLRTIMCVSLFRFAAGLKNKSAKNEFPTRKMGHKFCRRLGRAIY
jgi:hypothetical protein